MFAEDMTICAEMALPNIAPSVQEQLKESVQAEFLQKLVNQVATQLGQSDVYRLAVDSLQQLTAEGGIDGQILLKAVSLEAIRLTVEAISSQAELQFAAARPSSIEQSTIKPDLDLSLVGSPLDANTGDPEESADDKMFEAIAAVMQPSGKPATNPIQAMLGKYRAKRQAEAVEELLLTREEILIQIGERISLEREARSMSIAQLHARTFIPMYHLQALEGGHIDHLPEDIYLRGFLRRIENALSLTVGSLVEAMPDTENVEILPSWSRQSAKAKRKNFGGLDVNPTHLYFTYAALMAGGVCWLSQQTAPKSGLPELNYEPRAQNPASQVGPNLNLAFQTKAKAKLASSNASQTQIKKLSATTMPIKVGVAPPETMP